MLHTRIHFLRQKSGLSQSELAQMLHISASTVGMYEQGRRVPSVEMLVRLSAFFDVSLDYLVTGAEFRSRRTSEEMKHAAHLCPCSSCFWKQYMDK